MREMEVGMMWWVGGVLVGLSVLMKVVLKRANSWLYESKLGEEKKRNLPPGDLGLPFMGNMWSFLKAFKSSNPDSFVSSFVSRYGKTGIYKAFMFGNPSIIVTSPETCRKVLIDDENFTPGWPVATTDLIGKKSFAAISREDHKRLKRLTAAPINGHEALSIYLPYIEDIVQTCLSKFSRMGEITLLNETRKLTFRVIMYIFLSSESEHVMELLEKEYTMLNNGIRSMAVNLPGFAYREGLKARKRLVSMLQTIVDERRAHRRDDVAIKAKKDMLDALLEVEDDNGKQMTDEEIIDLLVMYLNAGHESTGHMMMWTTLLLHQHSECLQKAKAEQEEMIKNRPAGQKGLTLNEIRQMKYLSQVMDETLRWVTFSYVVFRKAMKDVNINGYIIPKGWKVLVWFRTVHLDPEIWPEPMKFNPDRWDGHTPKVGTFVPFGVGSRLCPGNSLAKVEIMTFLHHFLLNYRLEIVNPDCPSRYLPFRRPKDNCLVRIRRA